MAGNYFIKSGGYLFRLTKKAYQAWISDSTKRLAQGRHPAKVGSYGTNLGQIADIKSVNDFNFKDFEQFDLRDASWEDVLTPEKKSDIISQ